MERDTKSNENETLFQLQKKVHTVPQIQGKTNFFIEVEPEVKE